MARGRRSSFTLLKSTDQLGIGDFDPSSRKRQAYRADEEGLVVLATDEPLDDVRNQDQEAAPEQAYEKRRTSYTSPAAPRSAAVKRGGSDGPNHTIDRFGESS